MGVIPALFPLLLHGVETLPETVVYGRGSLTVPTIEALREQLRLIPGGIDVIDADSY